jgi:hypothetical protein
MSGWMAKVATEPSSEWRKRRLGGTAGNEVLTSATALVLTLLLLAEGVTIIWIGSLRSEHMFIGMALIPPVVLKLGSTGYRFVRYYLGTTAYREKGPPLLPLRLLAPGLVLTTLIVFVSRVVLLIAGHKSNTLFTFHKVSFIVWGALFGVHFLAHLPRMVRSLLGDWTPEGRRRVPGAELRLGLVLAATGGGVALALSVLPVITGWHPGG